MKKNILFIINFILFFLINNILNAQQFNVFIKGSIKNCNNGHKIYLYNNYLNDSCIVKNNTFLFKLKTTFPITIQFYTDLNKNNKIPYTPFTAYIAEPGEIILNADSLKNWTSNVSIFGGKNTLLFQQYQIQINANNNNIVERLKIEFNGVIPNNQDSLYGNYISKLDSLSQLSTQQTISNFIENNPNKMVSAYILNRFGRYYLSESQLKKSFLLLSDSINKSTDGLKIKQFIDGIDNSKIGNYLPNFKLINNKNKWISLSSFKGKYVLIDLWASWCGPCRMSFPTLNKLYNQYHKKGVEIISISIDQNKADWITALLKDKNPWEQVLDTKNIAQTLFAMTAIPYYILLDPTGKIIVKELGFNPNETSIVEKYLMDNLK